MPSGPVRRSKADPATTRAAAKPGKSGQPGWTSRFARNLLLALVPVTIVWVLLTPFYNLLLVTGAEDLLHWTEARPHTLLHLRDERYVSLTRDDFGGKAWDWQGSLVDVHFNLLMIGALFLAVPDVPWRRRAKALGVALLIAVFFHLALLYFAMKAALATQLGEWSAAHFGPLARNLYGMTWHLLDLPLKFALPFALWATFFLDQLPVRKPR